MDEREKLFGLQDVDFKLFSQKLIPTVDENRVIGVRTPDIKALAREIYGSGEYAGFISALPHYYYEENNLHGFIICEIKDFDTSIFEIERFLPFVDNWATCDGLRPKAFNRNRDRLLPYIKKWIKSKHTYTVRFGIGMLILSVAQEQSNAAATAPATAGRKAERSVSVRFFNRFNIASFQFHCFPVLPKPPSPRPVSVNASTMLNPTCNTGTMTSCAIRSIGFNVKAAFPRFQTETINCP